MVTELDINGRKIGGGHPCFIIAEAGVNHNGSLDAALELVEVAARAGADAVKFQTFKAEELATPDAPKAEYQLQNEVADESSFQMLRRLELGPDAHSELLAACRQRGILFLSTPFDEGSADLLDELGVAAFKIPSGEITNLPLIAHIADKGRPLIVSTGMSSLGEVEDAVRAIEGVGNCDYALLHCVSSYPADPAEVNLKAMETMAAAFGCPIGYSDHTLGIEVSLASVALGACVVEKHITLDREMSGPDHRASLEPDELGHLVRGIRVVETALGHGRKELVAGEANTAEVSRKSLVAARDIAAGSLLTEDMVAIRRPGTGLPPAMQSYVVGLRVRVDVPAGGLLTVDLLG